MTQCYSSGDFNKYFTKNMKDLGLPVPNKLFDTFNAAVATASIMLDSLATLGKSASVAEMIGATSNLEKLKVAAGLGAAYYVGAVIGSIAVASGRSLGCGTSIRDFFVFQSRYKLSFPKSNTFYVSNPEILNSQKPFRFAFKSKAIAQTVRV